MRRAYTVLMDALTAWLMIGGGVAALGVAANVVAMWLRSARLPGGAPAAALVGGALAGVLLGATVAGRVAPGLFYEVFFGDGAAAAEIDEQLAEHRAEIAALRELDVTPVAIDERRAEHAAELAPLIEKLNAAEAEHRGHWTLVAVVIAGAWLICGAAGAGGRLRRREPLVSAFPAIIGFLVCAGGPAFLLLRWTTDASLAAAAYFACAIAIGGAHRSGHALRAVPVRGRREVTIAAAATLVIPILVAAVIAPAQAIVGVASAAIVAAMVALIVANRRTTMRRYVRAAARAALPCLVAILVARLDFIAIIAVGQFWFALIIAAIFCSDGRWLGGWLGWRAVAHDRETTRPWSRSSAMLGAGVGGMQITLAGIGAMVGALPPTLAAAAALAALFLEMSAPIRQRFAHALDQGSWIAPEQTP